MGTSALISNIQGYSIHDGPGIRTVVFLKGCPLRCRWCANPENLEDRVRVGFLANLCQHCARCAKVCPQGAILPDAERRIDRNRCDDCALCVEACFYGALVRYGKRMTVEEVFDQVRRDKIFYDSSGGGVTVSGGEPLTHADFVAELFTLCREEGINTCVETCGCVPRSRNGRRAYARLARWSLGRFGRAGCSRRLRCVRARTRRPCARRVSRRSGCSAPHQPWHAFPSL